MTRVALRSHDVDAIKLILQVEGRSSFEQDGMSAIVGPRSWIVYDPPRPYSLDNKSRVNQLLLQVPRHNISALALSHLTQPRPFSGAWEGLPGSIAALMQSTMLEAARLDGGARCRVGDTLVRLATSLIVPPHDDDFVRDSTSLRTLRTRVKSYVESNMARGDLDIDEIARRMGCSRRYVFRAFEAEDVTPSQFLWDFRLERARERLAEPQFRDGSISAIASSCDFSSSAHFSRPLRKRYGMSPSDKRARSAQAG